ncbi:MAG: bifunctional metallophosphatase/5'-nucleotidase [Flavobacteriaceae bacterium]|jgi:2',3'-cyclic-nucleotide 2'-phosphodiesterase (5'-nucleotidase family)|nr:bifunctional metallophosphatase/5'-nucleotidase [Flavobacteriaceae bacterium]MBT3919708.1 bifunctional metallophosphatase/5'-nucleotidase [Flavobacteriaceae bacterium]MBT6704477.1 bifunctional metallophosphatase/5'-nucleotidase [Flavobacteriaceae bacterium]|tara:strand:- start:210 stop:1727 length:1518 start_codon:yes stop_codon:yes gene_type:complete
MRNQFFLLLLLLITFFSCKENKADNEITFKFIQVNDVYEIAPLGGGEFGGMARVAHVSDSIKKETPNTFLLMAGDFLNPSLLGTIKIDGERISGKQMIEVMNAMNFDLVTFGNHEFDIKEEELQKRLNESTFPWMSSNTRHVSDDNTSFFKVQKEDDTTSVADTYTINIKGANGKEMKIGFLGVTLPSNSKDFVYYGDMYSESERAYSELKNKVDLVFGLTHLEIEQDIELLKIIPEIPLIIGGHDHNSMSISVGKSKITKADANAKTIYIHTLVYNIKTKDVVIDSELFFINRKIASKPEVATIVNKWLGILNSKIKEIIKDPNEVIFITNEPLDGNDNANRGVQTNLGGVITEAMAWSYSYEVDAALVNGGSIRIDDMLPNRLSSVDIFRTLPFGGGILKVAIKGMLLKEVLDYGKSKRGTGVYLQRFNITEGAQDEWLIAGEAIDLNKTYKVALSDFLLKGYDIPFLTPENEGITSVYKPLKVEIPFDIRKAVILYLKSLND